MLTRWTVFDNGTHDETTDDANITSECYISLSFEEVLSPGSVTAECFAVTDDGGGAEIEVDEAVLEPLTNTVTLYVTATGAPAVECSVELCSGEGFGLEYIASSGAVEIGGSPYELIPVYAEDDCELFDISVMGISLYDMAGDRITTPVTDAPLKAKVRVVNGSAAELTRTLSLHKNSIDSNSISTQIISLTGFTAGEYIFEIDEMTWSETDTIVACIS